ncbi:hypothetical protein [Clostridium saccharobutylicum]|uniref:Uncharacterized protein n=1 Tax=Clostridium saccharobutylicum TaxID=169679 RepID=A0A1S8MYW2_CLOSA|nr:hypothetical protein [Clostridium saccharobutylicum]OOM09399.1 hypothetical protein CLOSAC_36800 [Clostridium saccharobutylicum]
MKRVFEALESTMNKSSIIDFRNYLKNFSSITKWIIVSDYCINDKDKPNDVMTFVIIPYVVDIFDFQEYIKKIAKSDLKHSNQIDDRFISLYKSGIFFSISFMLTRDNLIKNLVDKEVIFRTLKVQKEMLESWIVNTPNNANHYKDIIKKLNKIEQEVKRKTFNLSLFKDIVTVTFFTSYIVHLLYKEANIEIVTWFSDRDKMTSAYDGIANDFYVIQTHCLCVEKFGDDYKQFTIGYGGENKENSLFYDELNRIADYICGGIADHNIENNQVSADKFCKIAEEILADNKNMLLLRIKKDGIDRVELKSTK